MIYSASRRTDMPAFHPDALAERVGRSRKLDAIVFWTRDPRNLIRHPGLSAVVKKTPSIVQLTVTGMAGSAWEPRVPPLSAFRTELAELARMLPRGAVRWRFDPILPEGDPLARFRSVRAELEPALGRLNEVAVSFPDPYPRAVARAARAGLAWPSVAMPERRRIVAALAAEFDADKPAVLLCCEPKLLDLPGTAQARCVDGELFQRLYGLPLAGLPKDAGQRAACGCSLSTDIGSYDMACGHGCVYCYASKA